MRFCLAVNREAGNKLGMDFEEQEYDEPAATR